MKKQVLFIVLMLMPLMASSSTKINGIYYNLNSTNKVAEVTSVPYGVSKYTGSIVIPKTVTYGGVTYSVTSIGHYAFGGCSGLTSITIPNSMKSISSDAFDHCSGLTSINVESGNAVYDSRDNCNAIIETSSNTLITGCKNTTIPNNVKSIGNNAFQGCSGLTSINIPNSVTTIGSDAFCDCSGLTSITIPNSVTTIDGGAFMGCSGLTSITIPNGVTTIECQAFSNCSGLTTIEIPNSVTTIKFEAFAGCSGFTSVIIPNSVTSISSDAFCDCSGLTSIKVESGNTLYDSRDNCNAIIETSSNTLIIGCKSTTIPNSVKSIGDYAFAVCSGLTSVTIPNSVTTIGRSAFSGCSGLTSITIPNSVTTIGGSAFSGCSGLTSVTIGNHVTSIEDYAFFNCNNLTDVFCYAKNLPTTGSKAFYNTNINNVTLHVLSGSISQYQTTSPWSEFKQIVAINNKCATPTITFSPNGKIKVESATEGATCITTITASNAEPLTDEEISLNTPLTVYTVTAYATKEGYDDSEVATSTFRWEKTEGDMNGDGMLNISDVVKLVNMILGQ